MLTAVTLLCVIAVPLTSGITISMVRRRRLTPRGRAALVVTIDATAGILLVTTGALEHQPFLLAFGAMLLGIVAPMTWALAMMGGFRRR